MSDANIALVRRGYDAMQRRDVDELLGYCDPEVEFVSLVGEVEGRVYRGVEGIRQFFADLVDVWELWVPQPEHIDAAGDAVLATGTSRLRGVGSGLEMTVAWGQVFRFRDGRVLWARIYSDPERAREEFRATAAG